MFEEHVFAEWSTFTLICVHLGCQPPAPLNMSAVAFLQILKWQRRLHICSSAMVWVYFKLQSPNNTKNLLLKFLSDSS